MHKQSTLRIPVPDEIMYMLTAAATVMVIGSIPSGLTALSGHTKSGKLERF